MKTKRTNSLKSSRRKVTKKASGEKRFVTFTRPEDQSVEAYKAWIKGLAKLLGADEDEEISEEEWKREAEEFWSAARPKKRKK